MFVLLIHRLSQTLFLITCVSANCEHTTQSTTWIHHQYIFVFFVRCDWTLGAASGSVQEQTARRLPGATTANIWPRWHHYLVRNCYSSTREPPEIWLSSQYWGHDSQSQRSEGEFRDWKPQIWEEASSSYGGAHGLSLTGDAQDVYSLQVHHAVHQPASSGGTWTTGKTGPDEPRLEPSVHEPPAVGH